MEQRLTKEFDASNLPPRDVHCSKVRLKSHMSPATLKLPVVCAFPYRMKFTLITELMFAYNTNKCSCLEAGMMDKYIGRFVEIIYVDGKGRITQRKIEVLGVREGRVRALCLQSGAPRVFLVENILAMRPTGGRRYAS